MIAEGPPSRVLELAIDGRIELLAPTVVLDELERVLVDKLGFDDDHVDQARRLLGRLASARPDPPRPVAWVTGDGEDDAILASAVAADADVLVTGHKKHLLPLGEHRGVRVLTPQALLAEFHAKT